MYGQSAMYRNLTKTGEKAKTEERYLYRSRYNTELTNWFMVANFCILKDVPDPGSGLFSFLTPGSGSERIFPDPRSPNHISEIFLVLQFSINWQKKLLYLFKSKLISICEFYG